MCHNAPSHFAAIELPHGCIRATWLSNSRVIDNRPVGAKFLLTIKLVDINQELRACALNGVLPENSGREQGSDDDVGQQRWRGKYAVDTANSSRRDGKRSLQNLLEGEVSAQVSRELCRV